MRSWTVCLSTSWTVCWPAVGHTRGMTNVLSPITRAAIINFDPTAPHALSVCDFCRSLKISRSAFYKIRGRAQRESAAVLHPQSRAPLVPARLYGRDVIDALVGIRKQLKKDGWDYGPRSIHYEAALSDSFPGGRIPSRATIARLLKSVGHVDTAPRKRPKSSYVPFARSTAMALWQLDAFEYHLTTGEVATIYQLIDDATRFDVGTDAYMRNENSTDAKLVLERAINEYGAPQEVLSDNSYAFNQLRRGSIGSVEIFLASRGTMPISGLPGKPTTQGKNERSHQTLIRFLDANPPSTLTQLRARIRKFREHYNMRRPHQALGQVTPYEAWELLKHTPATEPIPLVVLEAKAAQYLQRRRIRENNLDQSHTTISKAGIPLTEPLQLLERGENQSIVEVTPDNRRVYFQGYNVSLPATYQDRQFYRTITDDEFLLSDPTTGEVLFSFPLPMVALDVHGRYIASYAIQGVKVENPTPHWERKLVQYREEFAKRQEEMPQVFATNKQLKPFVQE